MVATPQQATPKKVAGYELVREVCASSVGATFVARAAAGTPHEATLCTLTKLHRHVAKSPQLCDGFSKAAKLAETLVHPAVARVVHSGTAEGEIFVAYEHQEGDTLAGLLRRAGPEGLPLDIAERVMLDVAEAVAAAHQHGADLGHGELGPWCVHVGQDGRTRVSGFAVDRAITRFGLHYAKNLERLPYAAPERVKAMSLTLGPAPAAPTRSADGFSVGVLAWELFTRQRLFASRMEAAVIQKVLAGAIPDPKAQRAELAEVVSRAVVGLLARDPAERVGLEELTRALQTSEPASYEAVAEFVARQADKAPGKTGTGTSRAGFASVRPPPAGPAVLGPASVRTKVAPVNGALPAPSGAPGTAPSGTTPGIGPAGANGGVKGGDASADKSDAAPDSLPTPSDAKKSLPPPPKPAGAPIRSRAKTLMGLTTAQIADAAAAAGVDVGLSTQAKGGPLEEEATSLDDDLLEEATDVSDVPPPRSAPAAPPPPPVHAAPTAAAESPPSSRAPLSGGFPRAPRKPPLKPRQHTLMGIEPIENEPTSAEGPRSPRAGDAGALPSLNREVTPLPPSRPVPKAVTSEPGLGPLGPALNSPPAPEVAAETAKPTPSPAAPPVAPARLVSATAHLGGPDRLMPGALLGTPPHRYQLLAAMARGGMATVWAARPEGSSSTDEIVAIKTMLPELSDDPDFETMFVDEMRVAAKIQHPNVASILSVGEEDGVMYLIMEWVDGETFGAVQQAARSTGGVPLNVLVHMATDICAGLHAAHELKDEAGNLVDLVHRDVNPSNVMVGRDGVAKVVDFGIAKSKGRVHVTRAGSTVKGKTPYLSPEQLGGLQIDRRSDLFSLGALLYVMATGVHPFRGESELRTIENIVLKQPTPLRSLVPDIHPEFEQLVLRLLEKDAKKRLPSAHDVSLELQRIAALLEPVTQADVGAFVEKTVGDTLAENRRALSAVDAAAATALAAPSVEWPPLDLPPLPGEGGEVAAGGPIEPVAPLEGHEALARAETVPLEIDVPPSFDAAERSTPATSEAGVESGSQDQARPRAPWVRLVVLIVVGVAVGIGVIALIEVLTNKGDKTPAPSASAASSPATTQRTTATATVTATDAVTITPTETPPAPSESPAPSLSSAGSPPSDPSSASAPSATTPPPATSQPRPPTTGRPTNTSKPKPKPTYTVNPGGI